MPFVGWRDTLDLFRTVKDSALSDPALTRQGSARQAIATWSSSGDLSTIAYSDLFATIPVGWATRAEALRVPGVSKARALLMSLIAPRPLVTMDADGIQPPEKQPSWLYRTDSLIAPQLRTMMLLDDLIFHEATLLAFNRGASGDILDAVHCPYDRWEIDPDDGTILIDDAPVPPGSVLWIPGPWQGLLREASDVIRGSRDMTRSWVNRVRTPVPTILLEEQDDNGLTDTEIAELVEKVASARRSTDGTVMFVPKGLKATPISANDDAALFESGRNALRLDIANFMNMPAALIDGSLNTSTLTYDTRVSQRQELQDYTLSYWTLPIESALSQDSVCPRGTRIRFDFSDFDAPVNSPTGPTFGD